MKTALSMVALMVLLASGRESSSVAAEGEVRTSATPATQVYVRTDPAGAEVRLAGESKGRSPQLITVPDEAIAVTVEVELDGYGRQQRQVKIEGGRITRVEFKFDSGTRPPAKPGVAPEPRHHFVTLVVGKDRMTFQGKDTTWKELPGLIEKIPDRKLTVLNIARAPGDMTAQQWDEAVGRTIKLVERFGLEYLSQIGEHPLGYHAPETQAPPDQAGLPSFGPAVEQVLRDPEKGVAELLDLDTGRRATMKEFGRNDRETHVWIRQEKVDVMGAVERGLPGVLLFDCAVYDNTDISWEKITPQEVVEHRALNQNEPKPIIPLAAQDPSKLPLTCLFETREGTKGVLQLVGLSEDKQAVKIRYRLVRQAAGTERNESRTETTEEGRGLRRFVRLVMDKDRITFEGKETSWEELPGLLEKIPYRAHTVLEVALSSDELTVKQKNTFVGRAGALARQFEFEYLSLIGVHPLGSKGSPTQRVPDTSQTGPAK